jgi:hypothetical protein
MQPMGRKPVRFPGKQDCHPPKGHLNWWEADVETVNKTADRTEARKDITQALMNDIYGVGNNTRAVD